VLLRGKSDAKAVAAIEKQIGAVWLDYQSVQGRSIEKTSGGKTGGASTLSLDVLRQEDLDPNTILLEYTLSEPRSYLWIVSVDAIRGFELPGRARIEQASRSLWEALKSGADEPALTQAALHLSRLVLAPAKDAIANKRLLVVADGALHYVPFAALADPGSSAYRPLVLDPELAYE